MQAEALQSPDHATEAVRISVRRLGRGVFTWTDGGGFHGEEPHSSILSCVVEVFARCEARSVAVSYKGDTVLETWRDEMEHCPDDVEDRLQAVLESLSGSR